MNHKEFASSLRGVFGFPVTPFRQDLSLDLDGLSRNVDEMASYPFCAMVAAGGTGELYSMSADEIERVVHMSVEAVNGRMPIVAGTGYNTPMGVDIAKRCEKAGADCLLVLPPYYSNAPEEGLFAYYEAIGAATGLPLMIYSRGWAVFTPDDAPITVMVSPRNRRRKWRRASLSLAVGRWNGCSTTPGSIHAGA